MKRPLAFWIWPAIWLAVVAFQVVAAASDLDNGTIISWAVLVAIVVVQGGLTYALWRMSRIPVVIYFAFAAYNLVVGFLQSPTWFERYPVLGPFVPIILAAIFAITVLPHWNKMTWWPLRRLDFGSPKGAH